MKQLIQQAKNMFLEPGQAQATTVRRIVGHLEVDQSGLPVIDYRTKNEQQRIQLLETQNQQLRMDIEMWKTSSLRFACELRELLTDEKAAKVGVEVGNSQCRAQ